MHFIQAATSFKILKRPCFFVIGSAYTRLRAGMATGALHTADGLNALTGRRDTYDGLIIDPETLPASTSDFQQALDAAAVVWKKEQYRGIWLKLPIEKAHFVGPAVDAGFTYHHAEPQYIMLTRWLPETENKLPPNASHQVGVGAFVYDKESNKVLVVQERSGPLKGLGVWKMPTGLVQQGEDITEAAVREVEEETNIRTRFRAVLCMRQAHGLAFGKSDMFFVVALQPEPGLQELVAQEDEVEAVAWVPLSDFANDFMMQRPLMRKIIERCIAYSKGEYSGLEGAKMASSGSSDREDLLLFGEEGGLDGMGKEARADEDAWIGLS